MAHVVVVEDDPEICKMLVTHFEKKGDTVRTFGQAKHALEFLAHELPAGADAILLTDLGLPDMSGFELITRLRNDEGMPDIPVIVISARSGLQEHARVLDVGADDFIDKPFSLKAIDKKVRALLEDG